MRVQLKHIFSIISFLWSVVAMGQITDSLKVAQDSIRVSADTTMVSPGDTLKVNYRKDTVSKPGYNIHIDKRKNPIESLIQMEKRAISSNEGQPSKAKSPVEKEKKEKTPKVKMPKDTVIGPSGIEIALDYGKLLTIISDFESKAEAAVSFTFREKFQVLGEFGYGELSPAEAIKNGSYTSKGTYLRFGAGYGGEILPKSFVYLGLMYGISQFEDNVNIQIESGALDDFDGEFVRSDLDASWIEFILISETEIRNNLFLGSKWRLRNLRPFINDYSPEVYSIPGYGRTFDNSVPAVNIYVKFRFKL